MKGVLILTAKEVDIRRSISIMKMKTDMTDGLFYTNNFVNCQIIMTVNIIYAE